MAEATSGYMGLDKVGADLELPILAVKRLLARSRLNGVQLGPDGPWRVAAEDLRRYMQIGTPDRRPPNHVAGWFDPDETSGPAMVFLNAFVTAAAEGIDGNKLPAGDGPFVLSALTPAMRYAMTATVYRSKLASKDTPIFLDAFTAWGVDRLRAIAARQLRTARGGKPLEALYASPMAYSEVCVASIVVLLGQSLPVNKTFTAGEVRKFQVPLSIMLDTQRRTQILEAAF